MGWNSLEMLRGLGMLRATPLVFGKGRFPVLWHVLIRALQRYDYVYKMLTIVSLSIPSHPVTSQSTKDTLPVSSTRLTTDSDPGSVTPEHSSTSSCLPTQIHIADTLHIYFVTNF